MYPKSSKAPLLGALAWLAGAWLTGAAAAAPGIAVTDPWFRLITPRVPAGGYMTLRNGSGQAVTLTGARSDACGMLTLHRTEADRMVPVKAATIPSGGALALAPGGFHLMCMAPHMAVGDTVQVTLSFQDGATVVAAFPVIGARDHPPDGGR